MRIASLALSYLLILVSFPLALASSDEGCTTPREIKDLAANREWLREAVQNNCTPLESKNMDKSPACVRPMSGYSLHACLPICTTRQGQAGSGLYFRISSESGGACMENRRDFTLSANPTGIADAYRDRMVAEYKGKVHDRLKLTVSRLERLVTSPDTESLKIGDRPLREVFGETLSSARSFMDEMQSLAASDSLDAERLRQIHLQYNLLFTGCRIPIKPELDRCEEKFHLYSLDDMEVGLQQVEAAHPTTTIAGKLAFGLRSARKELMKESDELGYAINELLAATKCRDLRNELALVERRTKLPICGQATSCRHPSPATAIVKPVQMAVITIPEVIISGKFYDETDTRPSTAKAKGSEAVRKKSFQVRKTQNEAELAIAKQVLDEAKASEPIPEKVDDKPTRTPKTGNPEVDEVQDAIDRARDALKYTL